MSEITVQWLLVDKVHANKYNPNVMDEEKFEALCEFLRSHGAQELDPIWVRNDGIGKYEVIDGEHRWKAAKEVGWKKLRGFIIDLDADKARSFNVRKNRERGDLDAFKLGKIFSKEKELSCEAIAKKYGLRSKGNVSEYIKMFEQKDKIRQWFEDSNSPIPNRMSFYKAQKILRELKREERGEPTETEQIVEDMVEEIGPAIEKAFENIPEDNKHNLDRNKLVLNMLLKNLAEGLLFCPVCNQRMLECSHCHTSLEQMKEKAKL